MVKKKKRTTFLYLSDILECINLLRRYTKGKELSDFLGDKKFQDAVLRRIEIIGEAVKHLPAELRKVYDHIPWKDIAGVRDIFIHEYYRVDLKLAWYIATIEVPKLRRYLLKMLRELNQNNKQKISH